MTPSTIVTIRRVDPLTGRDVCSTATLRGNYISGETEPVYDVLDEVLMKRVDARYGYETMPKCDESLTSWLMRSHNMIRSDAQAIAQRHSRHRFTAG